MRPWTLTLLVLAGAGCSAAPRYRLESPQSPTATVVPMHVVGGLPVVSVSVAGRPIEVIVDLGGFDTLSLSPELMEAVGTPTGRTRSFRNARGERLVSREFLLEDVRLGDLVLHDVRAYEHRFAQNFAPPVKTGYLGRGVLQDFALVIDGPNGRLALARRAAALPYELSAWSAAPLVAVGDGAVVQADLGGRRRALLLDTGATHSMLRPDALPGLPAKSEIELDVAVGGHELGRIRFASFAFTQPAVAGYLGWSFFSERAVLVDFPERRIAFGPVTASKSPSPP